MSNFNQLIINPDFEASIKELKKKNINSPFIETDSSLNLIYPEGKLLNKVSDIKKVKLNATKGKEVYMSEKKQFYAYDESINKFDALEGSAEFTSHSLVYLKDEYLSLNYLTFYFFSNSKEMAQSSEHIQFLGDKYNLPEVLRKEDMVQLLLDNVADGSILLIDGPLIAGDAFVYMMKAIKAFYEKSIIPIFFVKNSDSNLVTDNIIEWSGRYNSDLHWAHNFLNPGERTNFFFYRDLANSENAKAFCYIKSFNLSPQRIEVDLKTYEKYSSEINLLMDVMYYLIIVQGDLLNPQVRPIAIAEKYARETLRLIDPNKYLSETGITPTMNQTRFGEFYG
tara:strand:+ start:149 stop:1162 length:1014 start_codon:yes stop_codon:yes gene_type:complete